MPVHPDIRREAVEALRELPELLQQWPDHLVPPVFVHRGFTFEIPERSHPFYTRLQDVIEKISRMERYRNPPLDPHLHFNITGVIPLLFSEDMNTLFKKSQTQRKAWNKKWKNPGHLRKYAESEEFKGRLQEIGRRCLRVVESNP